MYLDVVPSSDLVEQLECGATPQLVVDKDHFSS